MTFCSQLLKHWSNRLFILSNTLPDWCAGFPVRLCSTGVPDLQRWTHSKPHPNTTQTQIHTQAEQQIVKKSRKAAAAVTMTYIFFFCFSFSSSLKPHLFLCARLNVACWGLLCYFQAANISNNISYVQSVFKEEAAPCC